MNWINYIMGMFCLLVAILCVLTEQYIWVIANLLLGIFNLIIGVLE